MNKSLKVLFGFALVGMVCGNANAISSVRGAKSKNTINFSATAIKVCTGPGVAYSVLLATGASTDFVVLRDSNTANTTSAVTAMAAAQTAFGTQLTFDPPIQFRNGLVFSAPATLPAATLTFECGIVNQGY